ncbi:MAG: ankyrin repeat domain-containing protein, partial [Desulfobacterium sp.]|nr:ankyrin repeat domain-containing protein [Desulfobacterium sp.]
MIVGFDHGSEDEEDYDLHKIILESMSAEELIKESISENSDNTGPDSLLTFAILRPKLLKVLLEKGLNPNKANIFGKTPLMYAAQFNAFESAQILLRRGAYTEATTIDSGDTCNYTIKVKNLSALHYAVRYASMEFIKLLLDYGAPTYIADSEGYTPYDYLVKFGGFEFEKGYRQPKKSSCGDFNQNLTDDDRKVLKLALLPLDDSKKIALSQEENLKAEKLYQQG